MKRRAFTLIEILIVCILISLVSGIAYKIFSGTFSNFFKSQAKLTNLRSASILLEYLKRDLRLATISSDPAAKYALETTSNGLNLRFQIKEEDGRKMVSYRYADGIVQRGVEGKQDHTISHAKVAAFSITEESAGVSKYLKISIEVDEDMGEAKRSISNQKNRIEMGAIMFPKFFKNFSDKEEEYWSKARQFSGGSA